jgi:hypothetical protein
MCERRERHVLPLRTARSLPWFLALVVGLAAAVPAHALLSIDFEEPYYVQHGEQVWDFSLVKFGGQYHMFYHGIPEAQPTAAAADTIFHATSADLIHWTLLGAAITVSDAPFESLAIWAPDVFFNAENGLWWMAYTAVDQDFAQRGALAWSRDLMTWYKTRLNPVLVADPDIFIWNPAAGYANFRDPFVYFKDGQWNILMTAMANSPSGYQGVTAHATSTDQLHWGDQNIFFRNDGPNPFNVMESMQYKVVDGIHHLFFCEYAVAHVDHIAAADTADLSFANLTIIDYGIAPEVDQFEPGGPWVFGRIGPYHEAGHTALSYVARFDTLLFNPGLQPPTVYKPHPLDRYFASHTGTATLGNPCFGDNPARRGLDPVGLVGNFFFGSAEYYQGPLSGRGSPGSFIGDTATGTATTAPFTVEGNSLRMLVGGGDYPTTCYVALCDAATDTVIYSETGTGIETMSWRYWDLRPLHGRRVYLTIVDQEAQTMGHINVDEIKESYDDPPPPKR